MLRIRDTRGTWTHTHITTHTDRQTVVNHPCYIDYIFPVQAFKRIASLDTRRLDNHEKQYELLEIHKTMLLERSYRQFTDRNLLTGSHIEAMLKKDLAFQSSETCVKCCIE